MAAQNASTPGDKAVQKMDKKVPVVQETVKPMVLFTIVAIQPTFLMEMVDAEEEGPEDKTTLVEMGERYDVLRVDNVVKYGEQNVVLRGHAGSRVIRSSAWRRAFPGALPFEPGITIDWTNFMCRVSPNLTVGEVVQWNTEERPVSGSWGESAIMRMVDLYETIRAAWMDWRTRCWAYSRIHRFVNSDWWSLRARCWAHSFQGMGLLEYS